MKGYKQYYNLAMVEAVEPFKMHPTSMSYLYEVFEHLQLFGDGHMDEHSLRYHHRHSPGLKKLAKMLGDVGVQSIPFSNG